MNYSAYSIEEFIELVQGELTVSCALDRVLPDKEIQRIVEARATPWFWRNYIDGSQLAYYGVSKKAFQTEHFGQYKYIQLPAEIQAVKWIYAVQGGDHFFDFGFGLSGSGAVGYGIAAGVQTPFGAPNISSVGDATTYISVLGNFGSQLDALRKHTIKAPFNLNNKRLNVLTSLHTNLVIEAFVGIEAEYLYADPLFLEWVVGASMSQLANMLGRVTMPMPGGATVNFADIRTEGEARRKAVEDTITGVTNSSFFFVRKS